MIPATKTLLKKRWVNPAWLDLRLRISAVGGAKVMGGRSSTELFFLDEATALAAGHRPCFYCRRDDANRFRSCWKRGNRVPPICWRLISSTVLHRQRGGFASGKKAASVADAARQRAARWHDGAGGGREFF